MEFFCHILTFRTCFADDRNLQTILSPRALTGTRKLLYRLDPTTRSLWHSPTWVSSRTCGVPYVWRPCLPQMDPGFPARFSRATSATTLRRSACWSSTARQTRSLSRSCTATFKWKRHERIPAVSSNNNSSHNHLRQRRRRCLATIFLRCRRWRTRLHATAPRLASRRAWGRIKFWTMCQNTRLCRARLPILTGVLNKRHCK